MFEYAVLTTLYWAAFYGLYALVLHRNTFFQLNRAYLLLALAAGIVLPLFKDWVWWLRPEAEPVLYVAPVVDGFEALHAFEITVTASTAGQAAFPWKWVLGVVYLSGAAFGLIRFGVGLYKLWKLSRGGERTRIMGCKVVFTRQLHLPFSFVRTIYLSRQVQYNAQEEADILRHERTHVYDGHTLDVLMLELLCIVFWFSPPLFFYRRALRLLHEYIADASVLRTCNKSAYGRLLLRQAVPGLNPYIAHSFHSSLKQRIIMMTKTQSKPAAKWLYLAAIPVTLGIMLVCSQRSAIAAALPELTSLPVFAGDEGKSGPAETPRVQEASTPLPKVEPLAGGGDPEVMPVFAGCENEPMDMRKTCSDKKMLEHVYANLNYPEKAREEGISGMVVSRFMVGETGEIANVEIVKDIGGGCGEEVLRVLRSMPRWTPGMKEGKPVAVTLSLPIRFSLPDPEKEEVITADYSIIIDGDRNELKTSIEGAPTVIGNVVKKEAGQPLIYIDGKKMADGKRVMDEVDPARIKHIEVMKGEQAIKYAGEEGAHGVVLITLYADGEKPGPSPAKPVEPNTVFKVVEEMPRFPGCEDASLQIVDKKNCADRKMLEFIYQNLRYPASAREANIEGTVVISFIVEKDGRIKEPKILREIGGGCGDEVIRVVSLMPDWIPGKQKGEPVRVQFNLPVRFKLNENPASASPKAGLSALEVKDFNLYPNPVKDRFTLTFSAPPKSTLIQVKDSQGKAVFTRNLSEFRGAFREELDLSKAPKGSYIVVITQGDQVYTGSLVKQ